jgi:hypothetical protein
MNRTARSFVIALVLSQLGPAPLSYAGADAGLFISSTLMLIAGRLIDSNPCKEMNANPIYTELASYLSIPKIGENHPSPSPLLHQAISEYREKRRAAGDTQVNDMKDYEIAQSLAKEMISNASAQ